MTAYTGQPQNVNIVTSDGYDIDNFHPLTIGAYNTTNLDVEVLYKSDNTGGLVVEVANGSLAVTLPLGNTNMAGSTPVTIASDQTAVKVTEQQAPLYEDQTVKVAKVESRYSFTHIAGAQSAATIGGAIFLQRIIINTPAASGSVSVYDSVSNATTPVVAIATLPATLLSSGPVSVEYNIQLATGLTVAVVGAAMDVTIVWRGSSVA